MYKIRVPATSANLGSGFDSFGVALNLYNTFYIDCNKDLLLEGSVFSDWENNLVYLSAMHVFKKYYKNPNYSTGLYIRFETNIPLSRGLGSSASCIAGGVIGANLLLGKPYTKEELFEMAVSMEGHPDNLAPAFYGGFNIATIIDNRILRKKVSISTTYNKCCFFFSTFSLP